MVVNRSVHLNTAYNDLGQLVFRSCEAELAYAVSCGKVKLSSVVAVPCVGVQRTGQTVLKSVCHGIACSAVQQVPAVRGKYAVILEQPQGTVYQIKIKDTSGTLFKSLKLCEGAVLHVVQAASRADKVAVFFGIAQHTEHNALVKSLGKAV